MALPARKQSWLRWWLAFLLLCAPVAAGDDEFGEEGGGVPPDVVADPPPPMERLILDGRDVLILVNAASPVSVAIADLYRQYHPEITDQQVVYLAGLPDSAATTSTRAHEILLRNDYNTKIAVPVRNHMIANGLVNSTYVIITTAGMPYRIEDTNENASLSNVICAPTGAPSGCGATGSSASLVVANLSFVNAASVESELTCLFQAEGGRTTYSAGCLNAVFPLFSRVANPYEGYSSPVRSWNADRDILTRRSTFRYTFLQQWTDSPRIEGDCNSQSDPTQLAMVYNRRFSPGDMYLVARLDGPREIGQTPLSAVQAMLERAAEVSNPSHPGFVGYRPESSAVVVDFTPAPPAPGPVGFSRIINVPVSMTWLTASLFPAPPGADQFGTTVNNADHYIRTFQFLSRSAVADASIRTEAISHGLGGSVVWDGTATIANSTLLSSGVNLLALTTFGRNGNDGRSSNNYLLVSGPGAGPLFTCAPGAIFYSNESFNAVTMFSNIITGYGKIAQFLQIGGSGAIGHAFEPETSASIQGEFLIANYLRDDDGDGIGDLSFVEAAYTAIPYLSWAEVVLGDPLMRLRLAPDAGPLDAGDSDPVATAEEEAHADESASGDPDDFQP